jgi:hypothetical protein
MPALLTIDDIDERIRALEAELLELRQRRNSFAPICRLPPEILAAVFGHLQHIGEARGRFSTELSVDCAWSRVMLACRHFREVAVQTSTLWSVIDYRQDPQEWMYLCLRRSENTLISVRGNCPDVAEHAERVHSAQLIGTEAAKALLTVSTPALKLLSLYGDDGQDVPLVIAPALFHQSSATLVSLKLEGTGVSLDDGPSLPSLRRLELKSIRTGINFDALSRFLAQLPALEELVTRYFYLMESLVAVNANEVMAVPDRVSLPNLQELFVEDTPAEAWALLRLIPPPHSALGVSLTHISNFSTPELLLSMNHMHAFESWLAFSRRHVWSTTDRMHGCARLDHAYTPLTLAIITFGNVASVEQFGRQGESSCFCSLRCTPTGAHPLLDQIVTLHLRGNEDHGVPYEDLDSAYGVQCLKALDTLLLEHLRQNDADRMNVIRLWIGTRQGKIKKVCFVNCHSAIQKHADELRDEGAVPDVVWR